MYNNVTIVIPVYKDWSTLSLCIESLKKCVSIPNKVILINDMSPEWQFMEESILEAIKGNELFSYYKNDVNLGFVKTCNRAVFELDETKNDILLLNSDTCVTAGFLEEMQEILNMTEKHGAVCPRSNNATLLTVPVNNNLKREVLPEESYKIYNSIKNALPRYQVIPTGVGFALMIKRNLIEQFGLFDEIYGKGYNEENDFLMRINRYGYSVVMANQAYIYHYESRSFGKEKADYETKNSKILCQRYPYYETIVNNYFNREISPVDYFSDLIADGVYSKTRLLFSLYELPASYNGSAEYALSLLENFIKLFQDKYDIHILVNSMADQFHGLSKKYKQVHHTDKIYGTFHVAFVPSQIYNIEHLFLLNRHCLKYTFCMQDIISIRSNYLLINDRERLDVFRKSIYYCAGMTSISEFSLEDTKAFYQEVFNERDIVTKVIYHGNKSNSSRSKKYELSFDKYILVFGNFYAHKYLKEIMLWLEKSKFNYIIIGTSETGKVCANVYGYKSGGLEEEFIDCLIEKSSGILFPSVYEGFGLPILNAIASKKKIVLRNNQLNRELKAYFSYYSENIILFDEDCEVEDKICTVFENQKVLVDEKTYFERNWTNVAKDTESFINQVVKEKVDITLLKKRWEEMRYLENVHRIYASGQGTENSYGSKMYSFYKRCLTKLRLKFPKVYESMKKIKRKFFGVGK